MLYSSVPTDTEELDDLHNDINNGITPNDHVMITPAIIRQCVSRLKSGKGDGDIGFRSDHLMAHRDYSLFCRYCLIQCWCMVIHQTRY